MDSKKTVKEVSFKKFFAHKMFLRSTLLRREQYLYTNIDNLSHTLNECRAIT